MRPGMLITGAAYLIPKNATRVDCTYTPLATYLQQHRDAKQPVIGVRFAQHRDQEANLEYGAPVTLPEDLDMSRLRFIGCDFTAVTFPRSTDLTGTWFHSCFVTNATFSAGLHLDGVRFETCSLHTTRFAGTVLDRLVISTCEGEQVDFTNATLRDCTINYSALEDSSFAGATFARGPLDDMSLYRCWLTGCDLRGADLRDASLVSVNLAGAQIDPTTVFNPLADGLLEQILRIALRTETAGPPGRNRPANLVAHERDTLVVLPALFPCFWDFCRHDLRQRLARDPDTMLPLMQWVYDTLRPYTGLQAQFEDVGLPALLASAAAQISPAHATIRAASGADHPCDATTAS